MVTRSGKYGTGYSLGLNYKVFDRLSIVLSSGELIYGKLSSRIHNVSLIPISFSGKYYFSDKVISPFFMLEVSKYFGTILPGFPKNIDGRPIGEKLYNENKKFDLFGFGFSGGLGISNKISEIMSIELFYVLGIYSEDTNAFNSRLFLGFNYKL